jgi:5-methylcytosine-specific restriction endonuclease McrA
MSFVLVIDQDKRPLDPVHPGRARHLLAQGKAAVYRRYPFVLILTQRASDEPLVQPLRLKLDPGSITTGLAVVNDATGQVVWAADLTHRGEQVRAGLLTRQQVRRGRRQRHTRYRPPRFRNRRRPKGWLAPSLRSRLHNVLTWVKRLRRFCPIGAISLELVRFDLQLLQNPNIAGVEYQRGTLFGTELRHYLLTKWEHRCAYCSASSIPLEIDHVQPRSQGGSNRVSNLVIACHPCNQAKGVQALEAFLADRPTVLRRVQAQRKAPLGDAAAVNATRWALYQQLKASGLPIESGSGGLTKWNRSTRGLPKMHWVDAACCGSSTPARLHLVGGCPWLIEATGRQKRQMVHVDGHGFPVGRAKGPGRVQGFRTGDLVRAVVTSGKKSGTYVGRVGVKTTGYFKMTGSHGMVEGIHARYCSPLHRNDGYSYRKGKAVLPPLAFTQGASAPLIW